MGERQKKIITVIGKYYQVDTTSNRIVIGRWQGTSMYEIIYSRSHWGDDLCIEVWIVLMRLSCENWWEEHSRQRRLQGLVQWVEKVHWTIGSSKQWI